ncbi:MAG TPA: GTP cyclohydrolase II [Saprospiraceae bacterium]|nr:GTP cyclohydrolase II [Saprospiraceae bacterium]
MQKQVHSSIPTSSGLWYIDAYAETDAEPMPHLALYPPGLNPAGVVTVRIHSECITGDLFGSKRCDCGSQLEKSLEVISREKGILIYLRQEGRGIGLINKLKAYNLQDEGFNTVNANHQLGFETDERQYHIASQILHDLGIKDIRLLTNNPEKMNSLTKSGINIIDRMPLMIEPTEDNEDYLRIKRDLMGHLLD